mmetsp:Transcript_37546/g.71956  ORF Transcript_37546/g.71956 Transcript_37546/m.71956 type:complete len:265 (+) Transcript_37546:716-1510(+)
MQLVQNICVPTEVGDGPRNHALRLRVHGGLRQLHQQLQATLLHDRVLVYLAHGQVGDCPRRHAKRHLVRARRQQLEQRLQTSLLDDVHLVLLLRRKISNHLDGVQAHVAVVVLEEPEDGGEADVLKELGHRGHRVAVLVPHPCPRSGRRSRAALPGGVIPPEAAAGRQLLQSIRLALGLAHLRLELAQVLMLLLGRRHSRRRRCRLGLRLLRQRRLLLQLPAQRRHLALQARGALPLRADRGVVLLARLRELLLERLDLRARLR